MDTITVISSLGYAEGAHPAVLIWNYLGHEKLSAKKYVDDLANVFVSFAKTQHATTVCCKESKPRKGAKFCDSCGRAIEDPLDQAYILKNAIANYLEDLHGLTNDSISGDLYEFLQSNDWNFHGSVTGTGKLITVDNFDNYIFQNSEVFGDETESWHESIEERFPILQRQPW
tara:strand:- start:101487 stop:102002 length:516 start_codon:yes stop_codon:yes gene_type:complete